MAKAESVSEQLKNKGMANDMREHQQLKESHDKEVDATRRLYEKLKREGGEEYAVRTLRAKGYDPGLIRR